MCTKFFSQFISFNDNIIDITNHVKGSFRKMIVFPWEIKPDVTINMLVTGIRKICQHRKYTNKSYLPSKICLKLSIVFWNKNQHANAEYSEEMRGDRYNICKFSSRFNHPYVTNYGSNMILYAIKSIVWQ